MPRVLAVGTVSAVREHDSRALPAPPHRRSSERRMKPLPQSPIFSHICTSCGRTSATVPVPSGVSIVPTVLLPIARRTASGVEPRTGRPQAALSTCPEIRSLPYPFHEALSSLAQKLIPVEGGSPAVPARAFENSIARASARYWGRIQSALSSSRSPGNASMISIGRNPVITSRVPKKVLQVGAFLCG